MAQSSRGVRPIEPVNMLFKPLKADFKELFKALAKAVTHGVSGKWAELGSDAADALSSFGISTDPGELAHIIIIRALSAAIFELVGESANLFTLDQSVDEEGLSAYLGDLLSSRELLINARFLDRPGDIAITQDLKTCLGIWLERHGILPSSSSAIVDRLPSYFVFSLNQEWRRNSKSYEPLIAALQTPFTQAGDREWGWSTYFALLERRINESIFDEPFSLKQVFVPVNAYYLADPSRRDTTDVLHGTPQIDSKIVVSLEAELQTWLGDTNPGGAIRVISGGPGSGKSSFSRIFASLVARSGRLKVLFVPLHLIDPSKDLVDEIGRFVRDEGVLVQNPLDPVSPEPNLLIIFDGLDELASQGKAAAETARSFVREVEKTVEKRNFSGLKLRILLSGRELVVQENQSEFRQIRQILTLLPYFVPKSQIREYGPNGEDFSDPDGLLKSDLRSKWWKNYGRLTGKSYKGLPPELDRRDLDEITSQPLLNYLVALSLTRNKIDLTRNIELNSIYADLLAAVYERGYEKHRPFAPIRHMTFAQFSRVLEEIGLASWHGDGRTTSVSEIESHCRASGLGNMLDVFQEGAKAGVTKLLAAFFFRQYGERKSGDPTFVFTHKSFGEYLTSRRIARAVERIVDEFTMRADNPDRGWDERDALKHWSAVCGPTPISKYLVTFLINEVALRGEATALAWQKKLAELFSYMLKHGITLDQTQSGFFQGALFQSRNAEEALLVALNACARATKQISRIKKPSPIALGAWIKRIQGQRTGAEPALVLLCLSFLDLSQSIFDIGDFWGGDFQQSDLSDLTAHYATFGNVDFTGAKLIGVVFNGGTFVSANFSNSIIRGCFFIEANAERCHFESATIEESNFEGANLAFSTLERLNLATVKLDRADLSYANLKGSIISEDNFRDTILDGADLDGVRRILTEQSESVKPGGGTNSRTRKRKRAPEQIRTHSASGKRPVG